ncbi:MmgE/PrpD family protein [Oceanisphaera psychrotolerans]|uniref:2-methylcitrate dehydratase n=1 Tax=Oceanisphaera psychrotolerans TaxID=1414654 RepID=A0A1J4QCW3_9GAMM|nr:MmgE/PrpD family protein [Oceanisphaera psychrotolerans]OIN09177.1 2-methylcitrate dehydratase [Oceanisphaera psychrotolerans]
MSLYQFVKELTFAEIPEHTRYLVSTALLDILGVAAGARQNHTTECVKNYALAHYQPSRLSSRLLFDGRPAHPLGAAWVGGFTIDSLDAHEGHFTSKGHAGATVVPALLALVDACREQGRTISGTEFLAAVAIAYETGLRAGVALMDTAAEYHASGAFSGIGVVCGGTRLLGLDEEQFLHALGIAEYFGPRCPMMRLVDFPSMLRDAHGAGAYAGLNALLMAQAGITGAPAETVEMDRIRHCWQDLGQRWEIDAQYFKPWPVCRWAQPALTAATALLAAHPELDSKAIEQIRVETFHESVRLQGHFPANADEAQYGLAFPLAALISRGQVGPNEVTGSAIHAEDILAVSRRIEIVEADDLSARFPREILSRVSIRLKDGSLLESPITPAKGDPETAMTREEFRTKFVQLASVNFSPERIEAIMAAVDNLEQAADCSVLLDQVLSA